MSTIILSDLHAGWEKSNVEQFKRFLDNIYGNDTDELIIAGDLFDMWRRGISSLFIEFSDLVNSIRDVSDRGVDVVFIPGNHDWRLSSESGSALNIEPWEVKPEHRFTSGEEDFVVVHGHKLDPVNGNDRQNEALCVTDDSRSAQLNSAWDKVISKSIAYNLVAPSEPIFMRPTLRSLQYLSNPGTLSSSNFKEAKDRLVERIDRNYEDYVIFGHTHLPEKEDTYANCGSWTAKENTYIEVEDGYVELRKW